jgi:hypothetical protein
MPVAHAQSAAALHGVVCDWSTSSEDTAAWIQQQLDAGRSHILFGGGGKAFSYCAY